VAKRSPILGYNHNVRYRGLIFHVQTEDSGVLSPHLFTHLFHAGVIVSTRKLVYDAGADEGAIKSLMQAQHKAVMKDLKKGTFDEKIDVYLAGTPGLLPRSASDDATVDRDSQPVLAQASSPDLASEAPVPDVDATVRNIPSIPSDATIKTPAIDLAALDLPPSDINATLRGTTPARASTAPPMRAPTPPPGSELDEDLGLGPYAHNQTTPPRTRTAERGSAPTSVRSSLQPSTPPPMRPPTPTDLDGPTSIDGITQANVGPADSLNAIINLELEERPSSRTRRDTDVVLPGVDPEPASDGVPGIVGASSEVSRPRTPNESVPPLPPPPASSRPSAAGSLLPPRPPTRPPGRPAITPPQVVSRPIMREDREDSQAIEVYAPAPPSAEAPPGVAERERPGQYSQHKRASASQRMPTVEPPGRERSAGVPIPPGLGRPGNRPPPTPPSRPPPTPPPRERDLKSAPVPQSLGRDVSSGAARPRTPTPGRTTGPMASRPGSVSAQPNSGVVMTRPAVIVGAPAKPAPPSRVRKAREDEGRGFGQGLISEKSLDEVILAYLSEDADDK